MCKKINIIREINNSYNSGFYIDIKKNIITNFTNNLSIKVPFKIKLSKYWIFELSYDKNYINLNFILRSNEISKCIKSNIILVDKNLLFKILNVHNMKYNFKNKSTFKLNTHIDLDSSISILNNNIKMFNKIKMDELYYDLIHESIYVNESFDNYYNSNIIFIYGTIHNLTTNKKVCIIDHKCNFKNSDYIDENNYDSITLYNLLNKDIINIDSNFFVSNKYIKSYNHFHNNSASYYAFNNFKKYMHNLSNNNNFYNIELFDTFTIIIKNIDINKLIIHPVIFSKSKLIIINDTLYENDDQSIKKLLISSNNFIKNIPDNFIENHIFVDIFKKHLHTLYIHHEDIVVTPYTFSDIESRILLFNSYNMEICPINKCVIGYDNYCMLNCKHCFVYDKLWIYIKKHGSCPYCNTKITSINYYIYQKNIKSLLGNNFTNLININFNTPHSKEKSLKYLSNRFFYLYKTPNVVNSLIDKYFNIIAIDILSEYELDIEEPCIFILDEDITIIDILNIKININIDFIYKMVKLSPL